MHTQGEDKKVEEDVLADFDIVAEHGYDQYVLYIFIKLSIEMKVLQN